MYNIRGGDGKVYGPVSAEVLRQWLAEGRADANTPVQAEGSPSWQLLGSLPEFAASSESADVLPAAMAGVLPDDADAARRLAAPVGWAMIVVGALGILWNLFQGVLYAVRGVEHNPMLEQFLGQNSANSAASEIGFKIGLIASVVFGVVWAALVIFAGNRLRQLQAWGVALTGAILCLLPCCGTSLPVCFLSFPVGVWAIVILSKKKSAFG